MLDLWAVLIPILLADIVNPVLFAFMVYAVGTDRPLSNSSAALFGHTAAYLGFGVALAFAFDAITDWIANPKPIDYGIGLLIGVLLLWVAWRIRTGDKQEKQEPQVKQLTPLKAFGIGAIINIIGLPFALPYFAALDQILKADLTVIDSVIVIAGYNLGYALPFLVVPALALSMGDRSRPVLARINEKVDRVSAYLMPWMLTLVGIALVVDAIRFFAVGKGLF
jgi:cytochrome c biogenesis protein CcdA